MIKNVLILIILFASISNCTKMQESLSMKKKEGVDEFLIEKKNPLVLPPNYSKLPKPKEENEILDEKKKNLDLSKVLEDSEGSKKIKSSNQLEKSISNILKKK